MSTIKGMFCAGDASGASSHKFSSGSHAEGRIAAKSAVRFIVKEKPAEPKVDAAKIESLKEECIAPLKLFEQHKDATTDPEINPEYILPKMYMMRLQKLMDEYAGGVTAQFTTSKPLLEKGLELMGLLREDSEKLAARSLHELMRVWENRHRTDQAEAHVRTVLFREETRWPGYYFRADFPKMDEANWKCFVNITYNPGAKEWSLKKVPIKTIM
jgi:adenylylsulfate reductase, subunit A